MRVFLDTSVLVAGAVASHPAHGRVLPRLQRIQAGLDTGVIAAHSIAELYSALTRTPFRPPVTPAMARQAIERNVLSVCEVIALSAADYVSLLDHLTTTGVVGGATYDALLLHAAATAGVDQVLTLNARDFRRVYPALAGIVVEP